jgi:hypothetical protein
MQDRGLKGFGEVGVNFPMVVKMRFIGYCHSSKYQAAWKRFRLNPESWRT